MRIQKTIFLFITLFLLSGKLFSQGFDRLFYEAYSGSHMELWTPVMNDLEKEYLSTGNRAMLFDLAIAEYGYIANRLHEKDHKTAKIHIRKFESILDQLFAFRPDDPTLFALQSALYGYKVSADKHLAMFYGPKSMNAIEHAMALDSLNPFVLTVRANIEFYRPSIFGGSKEGSIPYFEKAVKMFEARPPLIVNSWIYLNCITNLAVAYEETGRMQEADSLYSRILAFEPEFVRVRDELYPRFKARSGKG